MASSEGKRFLVTGGSGFIGSNFIRMLYQQYPNDTIVNFDTLTYAGNPDNLADIEAAEAPLPPEDRRYTFIKGNICDKETVRALFSSYTFDYIVHFAAETHVDRSYFDVSDFLRTNIEGTHILIEAMRKMQPQARFVHISTDEIYGSTSEGYTTEESHIQPTNPYASSKAAADLLVQAFIKTHQVPAVIVRGSNNYGLFQYPEKLMPLAITNLLDGAQIPLHGSGEHARAWLHVLDFCSAIDTVLRRAELGSIYNVSGEERTNLELLRAITAVMNLPLEAHLERVADRPGADLRYAPNSDKLRTELGWLPAHTLEESLPEIIEWYGTNRAWWEKIRSKKEYYNHYEKQSKGLWY